MCFLNSNDGSTVLHRKEGGIWPLRRRKNRLRGWCISDFVLWGRFSWGPIVRIVAI